MKKVSFKASINRTALDDLRSPDKRYFLVRPEDLDGPQVRQFFADHEPPYAFAVTVEEYADDKTAHQLKFAHVVIREYARFQAWSEMYCKNFLKKHFGITQELTVDGEKYIWLKSFAEYTFDEMNEFLNLSTAAIMEAGLDIESERQKYLALMGAV